MLTSESVAAIFPAFVKAQGAISSVYKGDKNLHLGNSYAGLSSVIESIRPALAEHGLAFLQDVVTREDIETGSGVVVKKDYVVTRLVHQSGEWLEGQFPVVISVGGERKAVNAMQAWGSATTYARRYGLMSLLGVPTTDDDADAVGAGERGRNQDAGRGNGARGAQARGQGNRQDANAAQAAGAAAPDPQRGEEEQLLQEWIAGMIDVQDLESLKKRFTKAWKAYKGEQASQQRIQEAYEKHKALLQRAA